MNLTITLNVSPALEQILTSLTNSLERLITADNPNTFKVEKAETPENVKPGNRKAMEEDTETVNPEHAEPNKTTEPDKAVNPEPENQNPDNREPTIDFETLKTCFITKCQDTGKRDAIKAILSEFEASALSELTPADYGKAYELLKAV